VDVLLLGRVPEGDRVVLIRRRNPPFAGSWALPGGFVDVGDTVGAQGEDLPDAAARELAEETGLSGIPLRQVGAFGAPDRDPRHRTITVLYLGTVNGPLPAPRADDDAAEVAWLPLAALLRGEEPLAFDHLELVRAVVGEHGQSSEANTKRTKGDDHEC